MMARDDIVLACPVTEPYARRSDRSATWWLARAYARLLAASLLTKADIDGLCLSSFTLAPDGPASFCQHAGLSPRVLEHVPYGGACGVIAARRAAWAIQAGAAEVVACVAGDTASPERFRALIEQFSQFSRDAVLPHGGGGPNASFALITDAYMRATGAAREDFGRIALAQRANAAANPAALFRRLLTMADYLAARPIAPPVHLLDCVMPVAGAEGFLVMTADRARRLCLPCVRLLASVEQHNAFPNDPVQLRGGWDAASLWAQAGLGPGDMDSVQTYDDYPVICLLQLEGLGFCAMGDGAAFIRERDLTWSGDLPHNTGGGQLNCGQAGAAGGYLGLVEALRQLTRQARGRQVAGCHAVVGGFGMINYDRGLCTAAAVLGA